MIGGGGIKGAIQAGTQGPGAEGSRVLGIMSQSLPNCSWDFASLLVWVNGDYCKLSCLTGSEYPSLPACLWFHILLRSEMTNRGGTKGWAAGFQS